MAANNWPIYKKSFTTNTLQSKAANFDTIGKFMYIAAQIEMALQKQIIQRHQELG